MRKKGNVKKWIIGLSVTAVILAGIAVGAATILNMQNDKKTVEVIPVSLISTVYYGDDTYSYGTVSSDNMQSLYPDDTKIVSEIFVEEGQQVNIGDPLVQYDKETLELNLARLDLDKQTAENNINVAKRQLQRLKNTTAYVPPTEAPMPVFTPEPEPTETPEPEPTETPEPQPTETPVATPAPGTSVIYSVLPANAQPYAGTGTTDDPYLFLCAPDCTISPDFIAQLLGLAPYITDANQPNVTVTKPFAAIFEVRAENSVSGELLQSFTMDGTKLSKSLNTSSISASQAGVAVLPLLPAAGRSSGIQKLTDSTGSSDNYNSQQYTAEQLKAMIADKEKEIANLELGLARTNIDYSRADLALKNAKVLSTVSGVVQTLADPKEARTNGTAFLVVAGENTFYLNGALNESLLGAVQVGDTVTAMDFMIGGTYTCTIVSIDDYPLDSNDYNSSINPNTSNYAFKAIINDGENIADGTYMQVQLQTQAMVDPNALFIDKMYVREDSGGSYVFKRGADNRLEKQYISTGKMVYYSYIEIKSNLTMEDYIAFPYGSDVREGVRVKKQGAEDGEAFPDEEESTAAMQPVIPEGDVRIEEDSESMWTDAYSDEAESAEGSAASGNLPQDESNTLAAEGGVAV